MLELQGHSQGQFCDGVQRRQFLKIGGLALGGLTMVDLLRAEAQAGTYNSTKSIINIYLGGGPTHMDTFDLKPNAPKEYRGEFNPIATNAPGVEICELMPELATVADKYTIVRSITDFKNEHNAKQSESGWSQRDLMPMGGRPGIGAVMSKLMGPAQETAHGIAPTCVDLTGWTKPGFLGQTHDAYRPDGTGRGNLMLNRSVTVSRLDDRKNLLSSLDTLNRQADKSGMMDALDSFNQRAVGIITSGELYRSLETSNEDPRLLDRYGVTERRDMDRFLIARRLVTAGVRNVSFSWGGWDTHGNNFDTMRKQLPALSKGLTALIQDLDAHGRLEDTVILMSGEFGRTPRINGGAGRDHWPAANFFFVAGGGLQHGQVIGATNRLGERPQDRPVHLQNVFATLYHWLGIDPTVAHLEDPNGRPQYLVDHRQIIQEMV